MPSIHHSSSGNHSLLIINTMVRLPHLHRIGQHVPCFFFFSISCRCSIQQIYLNLSENNKVLGYYFMIFLLSEQLKLFSTLGTQPWLCKSQASLTTQMFSSFPHQGRACLCLQIVTLLVLAFWNVSRKCSGSELKNSTGSFHIHEGIWQM